MDEHKTGGNTNGLESMPPQQSWEATYYTCFPSGSPAVPKIKAPTDFSTSTPKLYTSYIFTDKNEKKYNNLDVFECSMHVY